MESDYLKKSMADCLLEGMTELAFKQPADPIEYLAHWILTYKENVDLNERRERFQTLKEELQKVYAEEKMMEEELMKEFAEKSVNTLPVLECPKTCVPPALAAIDEVVSGAEGSCVGSAAIDEVVSGAKGSCVC